MNWNRLGRNSPLPPQDFLLPLAPSGGGTCLGYVGLCEGLNSSLPPQEGELVWTMLACTRDFYSPLPPQEGELVWAMLACARDFYSPLPPQEGELVWATTKKVWRSFQLRQTAINPPLSTLNYKTLNSLSPSALHTRWRGQQQLYPLHNLDSPTFLYAL